MSKPIRYFDYNTPNDAKKAHKRKFLFKKFGKEDSQGVIHLIRENMREFDQQEKVLSTTYRRLDNFVEEYFRPGSLLYVIKDEALNKPIACIGLGSFQGLPWTERIGEIRDLVVHKKFRQQGLGQELLKKSLIKAKTLGYKRIYLETSKHMLVAQKLFTQNGFHPVEQLPKEEQKEGMPCYFLLKDLDSRVL